MGNDKKHEKILKDWLLSAKFSRIYADEDTLAPEILRICLQNKGNQKHVLAVSSYAEAEELCHETRLWAHALGIHFSAKVLPEGMWKGKMTAEDEAPRAGILAEVLSDDPPELFIGSVHALLAPVPSPEEFRNSEISLRIGDSVKMSFLTEKLVGLGYDDEVEALSVGEFSKRGGILDIYSPGMNLPVRIEFFGDEIDSIREYSPSDGRSVRTIEQCRILARSGTAEYEEDHMDFSAYTTDRDLLIAYPESCRESLLRFGDDNALEKWILFQQKLKSVKIIQDISVEEGERDCAGVSPGLKVSAEESMATAAELSRNLAAGFVRQMLEQKYRIFLAAASETDFAHIAEWLKENDFEHKKDITAVNLPIPSGIILHDSKTVFLTERELFSSCLRKGRMSRILQKQEDQAEEQRIDSEQIHLADIDEGDYTVHLNYGLCKFRGITTVKSAAGPIESMELEFADETILYVPVSQAHLLTRYVGSRTGGIKLSRPGSTRWLKTREEAGLSAKNLACEMFRMQAVRKASEGVAFPHDSLEQRLFEDSFPFEMTPGQQRSVEEIKSDMEQKKPMDRLLCGDVGYGKTEVALRAAFKCVQSGRQVAVLVPTTVLAQQHFQSFSERFAEYPYVIETLSRLKKTAEKREVLFRLASGGIDIVIGTHALLNPEIKFRDLGLVIIDEEQKFGVEHKEKLKAVRATVDVLTMTATPIPRTLHMSMSGLRDLSVITTAPVRRLPVHTIVMQYDSDLITAALERELGRGGQVFYLHNRVNDIEKITEKIHNLVPNARIAYGHGQMSPVLLEETMSNFVAGDIDILVCTTIIESGIDIPNANTIIIDRADTFGLAELHQLRGRVGRWTRQAYAYLLVPPSGIMTTDAKRRMSAIRRYTQLGSGFKLALQDLEIRGAGNIIGAEQSGYVDNIGFHLYCQLLREAADSMRGAAATKIPDAELNFDFLEFALETSSKSKIPASIPQTYIEDQRLRLDAYKRLALMPGLAALADFESELKDKFGPIPKPVQNYLKTIRLKLMVFHSGWKLLSCHEGKIFLEKQGEVYRENGIIPHIPLVSPEKRLDMLIDFMETVQKKNT